MDLFELAMLKHGASGSSNGVSWENIKDKPFYETKETILRNTYEDWVADGGDSSGAAAPTLSFIIKNEIFENIVPSVYNTGYTKVYNIPSYENRKYQIVAGIKDNPPRFECTEYGSGTIVENWSIYPPEEKVELRYLDPKFIEDMYYTEPEKWGTTYEEWASIVKNPKTPEIDGKSITIKYNGTIYKDVVPSYIDSHWYYNVTLADGSKVLAMSVGFSQTYLHGDTTFFVDGEVVHKIPEKYYDSGPFIITVTALNDDGTCEIDRTWDEIKEEYSKNDLSSHYSIYVTDFNMIYPCTSIDTSTIGGVMKNIHFFGYDLYADGIEDPEELGNIVTGITSDPFDLKVSSEAVTYENFYSYSAIPDAQLIITEQEENGAISVSSGLNQLIHYLNRVDSFKPGTFELVKVLYNQEYYDWESFQVDDNGLIACYFSTTANGVYRRLKVTPGETEDSNDIITIDKEIDLNNSSAPNITGATVGQIPVITAVDSNGKPTAWGSADMPGGTDLNAVNVFVADFAHDTMTVTSGAVDKYSRVVVS